MSEADKLFEELGYKPSYTFLDELKFYKDDDNAIYFMQKYKLFIKSDATGEYCGSITMQELQAINLKCKELGWID